MANWSITKVEFWNDPGYTRGCSEVPQGGSVMMPSPTFVFPTNTPGSPTGPLKPRKDAMFTSLELPMSYNDLCNVSYIYIQYSTGNVVTANIFGWVNRVVPIATSDQAVRVEWEIDYWRTFASLMTYGAGRIKRVRSGYEYESGKYTDEWVRPGEYIPAYWTASKMDKLNPDSVETFWVIIKTTYTYNNNPTKTTFRTYFFPINTKLYESGADIGIGPGMNSVVSGKLDEYLALNAAEIIGAWICPFCPASTGGVSYDTVNSRWDSNPVYIKSITNAYTEGGDTTTYAAYYFEDSIGRLNAPVILSNVDTYMTSDTVRYGVTDFRGSLMGEIPWGKPFDRCYIDLSLGATSAEILYHFCNDSSDEATVTNGMTITVPLPTIPIGSNSWSEYVYSGQRDYEIQLNDLNIQQGYEKGAIQGLSSAMGGAVGGAMAGKGLGAAAGASAGLAIGQAQNIIMHDIDLAYRDRFQEIEDRKHAMQQSTLLLNGEGVDYWSSLSEMKRPALVKFDPDPVTLANYQDVVAYEGLHVDRMLPSIPFIIYQDYEGPLRVENLNITGTSFPEAKQAIKLMLEKGIRITIDPNATHDPTED